nr:hypothetical protein [Tanacetum cinerariifolium]
MKRCLDTSFWTDTRDIDKGGDDRVTHPVVSDDVQEAAQEERVAEVIVLTERIAELEMDNRRLKAEEMKAREAAMNFEPLNESEDEQEGENRGNGNGWNEGNENGRNGENRNVNGGNGNGRHRNEGRNKNGNRNGNHGMNYRGFMPVARECMFQDFLKCKPYNFSGTEGVVGLTPCALTWWNSHNRTIGVDAAYAIKWAGLMKLMTEELILLCARMIPDEEDRGYAAKSAGNKRRMKSNPRDNHGQQPPFKRQNVSGQNVARVYTARNNERIGYARPHPLYNKCRYHHVGPCTVKCNNCKKVSHQTRDYRSTAAFPNMQRAPFRNQQGEKNASVEEKECSVEKKECFVEEKTMFLSKRKNVSSKKKNVSSKRKNIFVEEKRMLSSKRKNVLSKRKNVFVEEKKMFSSKRKRCFRRREKESLLTYVVKRIEYGFLDMTFNVYDHS